MRRHGLSLSLSSLHYLAMPQLSTTRARVEHGLDTVLADRTVTVSLRDLLFIHQTLGEFVQFFHQPLHYPDLAAVERFLGSRDTPDAYGVLSEAYYLRIRDMIPADVAETFFDIPPESPGSA